MGDFVETFTQEALAELRRATSSGVAQNDAPIVPGVYLSWDAEGTGLSIDYTSPDWACLSLDYSLTADPRWFSLNLALADGVLEVGDTLGLVVEGYARQSASIRPRLRTQIGTETVDMDWNDTIDLAPSNTVSVALHTVQASDGMADREGYHTLILTLPARDTALTFRNMSLFRVPVGREIQSKATTLSSFAV